MQSVTIADEGFKGSECMTELVRTETRFPGQASWRAPCLVDSGCLVLSGQVVASEVSLEGRSGMSTGEWTSPTCSIYTGLCIEQTQSKRVLSWISERQSSSRRTIERKACSVS